jgi:hypothetical protein
MTRDEKIDKIYDKVIWMDAKLSGLSCVNHSNKLEKLEAFKNKFIGLAFLSNLITGVITFILTRIFTIH